MSSDEDVRKYSSVEFYEQLYKNNTIDEDTESNEKSESFEQSIELPTIRSPSQTEIERILNECTSEQILELFKINDPTTVVSLKCHSIVSMGHPIKGCLSLTNKGICYFGVIGKNACPTLTGFLTIKKKFNHRRWFVFQHGDLFELESANERVDYTKMICTLKGAHLKTHFTEAEKVKNKIEIITRTGIQIQLVAESDIQYEHWYKNLSLAILLLSQKRRYGRIILPFQDIKSIHWEERNRSFTVVSHLDKILMFQLSICQEFQQFKNAFTNLFDSFVSSSNNLHSLDNIFEECELASLNSLEKESTNEFLFRKMFDSVEHLRNMFICTLNDPKSSNLWGSLFITDFGMYFCSFDKSHKIKLTFKEISKIEKIKHYFITHLRIVPKQGSFIEICARDLEIVFSSLQTRLKGFLSKEILERQKSREAENQVVEKLEQALELDHFTFSFSRKLKIVFLTIGTRGDVQPYVALAKRLQADGHHVRIATHDLFKEFVESFDIEFAHLPGDPKDLIELCVSDGMFTPTFMKNAIGKFRGIMENILWASWDACQGQDVIIEAPMVQAGLHIAEKLNIAHFIAFTMPFSKTKSFANPFLQVDSKVKIFNSFSYSLVERMLWFPLRDQINKFRTECCKLPPITVNQGITELHNRDIPYLYCFSPLIVPKPTEWEDRINICGYWFLPPVPYTPPEGLVKFLQQCKTKPIYVGFGSIVIKNPELFWDTVIEALIKTNRPIILSKGWTSVSRNYDLPDDIYVVDACPHDWLFKQVGAVCHHGGAGTTAVGLYNGCPTLIVSFFGDQPFWGSRMEELGVGATLPASSVTVENLSLALTEIATSTSMMENAKSIGEQLQKEDGTSNAADIIYRNVAKCDADNKAKQFKFTTNHVVKEK